MHQEVKKILSTLIPEGLRLSNWEIVPDGNGYKQLFTYDIDYKQDGRFEKASQGTVNEVTLRPATHFYDHQAPKGEERIPLKRPEEGQTIREFMDHIEAVQAERELLHLNEFIRLQSEQLERQRDKADALSARLTLLRGIQRPRVEAIGIVSELRVGTLRSSDNEFLKYPCRVIVHVMERGTSGAIIKCTVSHNGGAFVGAGRPKFSDLSGILPHRYQEITPSELHSRYISGKIMELSI